MTISIKHILLLCILCSSLLIGGCKEPTDLGGNIIIEPKSTKSISSKDISISFFGKGNYSVFNQRDPDDLFWTLSSLTVNDIIIDTTLTHSITLSVHGEGIITRDATNELAKSFPTRIRFDIDSLVIPTVQSDPKNQLPPRPILLDDAELEITINNRKMTNGVQKLDQIFKKISLRERENFLKSFVSACTYPPNTSTTGKGELNIFLQFLIPNIEVINDNKKEKSFISGETAIKLKW
jgi:hypothetical protein